MNKALWNCLGIAAAGSLGALARYGIGLAFGKMGISGFPWNTLVINITGAFLLGWVNTALGSSSAQADSWRIILGIGFLGAYTTFSSMMFESDKMFRDADYIKSAAYLAISLFVGLIAVRLGVIVGQQFAGGAGATQ